MKEMSLEQTDSEQSDVRIKASAAIKWSLVTEVMVKLITPITQVALAHILAPEAFGVVATVTMVISFADMLSDAGFQKYLVQHEFSDEGDLFANANVAFWTNLTVSLSLWLLISVFSNPLATAVGCDGLGLVLVIAGSSLPLTALSSIQLAMYHRNFNFKDLLAVRVAAASVPLFVTIPLAILGLNYWSLVIGIIAGNVVNAVALTARSSWKPSLHYSWKRLLSMMSFSAWTLLESISIWLTSWVGTFILGSVLSPYYLGLYKTSIGMVNAAMGIITSATTPILFSALSRFQNDEKQFQQVFFEMQKKVAFFVVPLGVGIFVFRDFATELLLGPQWHEAAAMLGYWGLSSSFVIILSHYASEVFRSKGRPRLSFYNQCVYLCILIPATYFSAQLGFDVFALAAAITRVVGIGVGFLFLCAVHFPITRMCSNIISITLCASAMGVLGSCLLAFNASLMFSFFWIVVCAVAYAVFCLLFPDTRAVLFALLKRVRR